MRFGIIPMAKLAKLPSINEKSNVHKIQVYQLLLIEISGCDVLQDVGEKSRYIFSEGHRHDRLLDGFLPIVISVYTLLVFRASMLTVRMHIET